MALTSRHSLSLAGTWEFRPDDRDEWHSLDVPGCWESLGLPRDWEGPGWYRRTVEIPEDWRKHRGGRLWLHFGGVSYSCQVTVNGVEVGDHLGAWDAFTLEITEAVGEATTAEIVARVVKPGGETYPVKQTTAGFLPYVGGYLFGGIWQEVRLELTGPVRISDTWRVEAPNGQGIVTLISSQETDGSEGERYELTVLDANGDEVQTAQLWGEGLLPEESPSRRELVATVPPADDWTLDAPNIYMAVVQAYHDGRLSDEARIPFGFREVRVQGDRILLNDRPLYPRMALSWGWFPDLSYPNPPKETLRAKFEKLREMGYNGVKCCLWVPPPAYLDVCDEMGILVWLELPLWLPEMNAEQQEQTFREYEAIVRQVRHHPCIILWTLGCELSASCGDEFLKRLYTRVKEMTGSPLVRDNSGGGECYGGPSQDYADYYDYHFYCDLPFLRNTFDYFLPRWRATQPWLFGEFCDADAFRDLVAIKEANGGELPWWAVDDPQRNSQGARWERSVTRQWAQMEKHGLLEWRGALRQGQRRQTLAHRKFTVELVRSYREMSGYVITGIRDTPISTAGMFDDSGELRYLPEDFSRFNADTILFLSWPRRRHWNAGGDRPSYLDHWTHWAGETLLPRFGISHYGSEAFGFLARWELRGSDGSHIATGDIPDVEGVRLLPGAVQQLGFVEIPAPAVTRMSQTLLRVMFRLESGHWVENEWPLWVVPRPDWKALPAWSAYDPDGRLAGLEWHGAEWKEAGVGYRVSGVGEIPMQEAEGEKGRKGEGESPITQLPNYPTTQSPNAQHPTPNTQNVVVASRWEPGLAEWARNGGKAFVFVDRGGGLPVVACPFWREAMKLFEEHPFWFEFPHEGFTDLNFYGLGPDCAFDTEALAALFPDATLRPILRRVDARTFAVHDYLTEATFPGGGRLLLTTLRPHGGLGDQPDGLLRHVAGVHFLASALKTLA